MGKVPALETPQGTLCENQRASLILGYTLSRNPIYPSDSFAKAKVKDLVKMVNLH